MVLQQGLGTARAQYLMLDPTEDLPDLERSALVLKQDA